MVGLAVFTRLIAGAAVDVTIAVAWFEVTVLPLKVVLAVAIFVTEPAFRSACVIVYVVVQVTAVPGAKEPSGQEIVPSLLSLIVNGPGSVTVPVFLMV